VGVGAGEPPEPEDDASRKPPEPRDNLLGVRNRVIVGVVFAALYIVTFGPRTGWVPGVVSGVLGGIVFFMLLKQVDERRRRRRR
jgi:hypothetical protein